MPLALTLDLERRIPIYRQIFEGVLAALTSGALTRDEQLPTIHQLAGDLGVNPNTVARAYRDLESAGHIVCMRGRGTFPAASSPEPSPEARDSILADLFKRTLAEAARHGLGLGELARYFQTRFQGALAAQHGDHGDSKTSDRK